MTCTGKLMIAAAGVVLVAGCESDRSALNEFFPRENRATHAVAAAHAEAGARADATLHAHHFDGSALNALGRAKLDHLIAARGPEDDATATVYLNLGEGADADGAARRNAASLYLREHGVPESQFKLVAGPNPNATTPAAGHLSRMNRTEGESTDAGGAGEKSTPGFMPDAMTK